MSELITVKATNDKGQVVLWEIHPLHVTDANKSGEVWISGNGRTHQVGKTPQVQRLLASSALVEVSAAANYPTPPEVKPQKWGSGKSAAGKKE